jgi:hypothetical protein
MITVLSEQVAHSDSNGRANGFDRATREAMK